MIKIPELKECLSFNLEKSEWNSKCDLETMAKYLEDKKTNFNPSLRHVVGKILHQQISEIHTSVLKGASPGPQLAGGEDPGNDSEATPNFMKYLFGAPEPEAHLEPKFNPEAVLIARTRQWVEEAEGWLLPIIEKDGVLDFEAAYTMLMIYGDSLRFSKVNEFVKKYQNILFKYRVHRESLLKRALYWVGEFGAYPIRDWVLQELTRWRSSKIDGRHERDFFFWTESLKLAGVPQNTPDRKLLLDRLNQLWLYYPKEEDRRQLRSVASVLKVSSFFRPPSPSNMDMEELIESSEAWVRAVDGEKAQKTLDQIFNLPTWKRKDKALLWKAFNLHIKIYRILDQRPKIPALIQKYLQIHRYLRIDRSSKTLAEDIDRAIQIASWFWTYERTEEAKSILKRIVSFNKKNNLQLSLAESEYYLARISEQSFAKKAAINDLTESLKWGLTREMRSFVLWRRLFLKWELSESVKDLAVLHSDLKEIQPLITDDGDQRQLYFWLGRLDKILGNKKQALLSFKRAYESDPYSFYGAMSGIAMMELGVKPPGWKRVAKKPEGEPNWDRYFSSNGNAKDPQFYSLSRVYFLAKAGYPQEAEEFFSSVDASAWRYILRKKNSKQSRLNFSRSVAWLRESLGDPMGALRMGEISRQAFGKDIGEAELAYLYPLAFWDKIKERAKIEGISPWIVASLIRQESAYNPKARSWANALGLMQMIPPVAEEEAKIAGIADFDPEMLYRPEIAVQLGAQHLAGLLKKLDGSLICAFAAYNAGMPPVEKWKGYYPKSDPLMFIERISYKETRNYVQKLLRNYINYQRFYGDAEIDVSELMKMPGRKSLSALLSYENTNWSQEK